MNSLGKETHSLRVSTTEEKKRVRTDCLSSGLFICKGICLEGLNPLSFPPPAPSALLPFCPPPVWHMAFLEIHLRCETVPRAAPSSPAGQRGILLPLVSLRSSLQKHQPDVSPQIITRKPQPPGLSPVHSPQQPAPSVVVNLQPTQKRHVAPRCAAAAN